MRQFQMTEVQSTTYHPQTNGLFKRHNRTLIMVLSVFRSWYVTDWDSYLLQLIEAYNSTQHSATGFSPHMMLTGHEKTLPLAFVYPDCMGKRTTPQVFVRDLIRCQKEVNDMCRRNTQQTHGDKTKSSIREKRGLRPIQWVIMYGLPYVISLQGTKRLFMSWNCPFLIMEV